ncbi:beta-ketoacyl-[acyl-carrier-protein] synthase family protein [Curvibacter sp. RS43]|uniref:beta-ketoacyl-[acyl-carrier-protein] synthase family protein n=1 Tax=Curvibacter microcysteis TaxID=3026419 RepID=UPI00235FF0BB|nr:beta-ketoacyl-[acyl-carrier-protein] synthase family protein [Curvibacter sp. RS43]MDD0811080.1 beta-ketoacyl-[acyl-carrier-protein] synthase family protein [Curvibacter sp. RS43]
MNKPSFDPVGVAGIGLLTPLGQTLDALGQAVRQARSAVTAWPLDLPGIDPAWLPLARCDFNDSLVRTPSRIPADRGTAMALAVTAQAFAASGLDRQALDAERVGLFWGSGMAGAHSFDSTCQTLYGQQKRIRPTTVLSTMPNAAVAEISLQLGIQGATLTYACACASSAVAIGEAMRALRGGWLDVAVVGGHESMLSPGVLASWQAMRVLAPTGPEGVGAGSACRPFSADRQGFAMGEGAAALVLESQAHAQARGTQHRLQLTGYATNCDSRHISQPDAEGQARAMRAALRDAGLQASDVGYLNAHGTATVAGDQAEADSVAAVFGPQGVPVSSTKAIHGHLLGAGGAVELVVALQALDSGLLPPTAHLLTPGAGFALDLIQGEARSVSGLRHVMSNSFAFGGTNAVLIASLA